MAPPVTRSTDGAGPTDPAEVAAFFDRHIGQQLTEQHIAGATVAVVQDGAVLFAKGYGYADVRRQLPVDADRTLFHIGSVGKLFTWTAVMQLVEQGRLDLHADVNTYLDFRVPDTYPEPITIAHLLTHTAGFEEQFAALFTTQAGRLPLRDYLTASRPARVYPPGRYSAYSNYGAALAGYIVQRVSGEPYERYLANHLLTPLGMTHSAATQPLPPDLAPDLSLGYAYNDGTYDATDFEWIVPTPAAPIRATATDMAQFLLAHLQDGRYGADRILGAATAQTMHRQQFTHDPRLPGLAYGFFISRQNEQSIIWHDGTTAHFVTILGLLPERGVGLFVSYNTPGIDPGEILTAFVDHYYPSSAPPPQPVAAANAGRFAGTFLPLRAAHTSPQKAISAVTAIQVRGGGDTLEFEGHGYVETEPGLFSRVDGGGLLGQMAFRTDAQGRVTHLFRGPIAFAKVPWYATLTAHLAALALCLILFLTALVAWPLDALIRRRRQRPPPTRGARLARWVAGCIGPLSLLPLGWFALLMLGYFDSSVYPGAAVAWVTRLLLLMVPLAGGIAALAVLAWKRRYWNLAWRLHYTAIALGAVPLIVVLNDWHLLGMGD